MRGKGKGNEQAESKNPLLLNPDVVKVEPTPSCYESIIDQNEDMYISLKDLDTLQRELEGLLVAVFKRRDGFENELRLLTTGQDRKGQQAKQHSKMKLESNSGKRSSTVDNKSKKNSKKGSCKPAANSKPPPCVGGPKGQQRHMQDTDDSSSVSKNQQNDAPSRFWESLKPYCADITKEHTSFLEEWIKPDEELDFEIPILGRHYTYEWHERDCQEEERESSKPSEKIRTCGSSAAGGSDDSEPPPKRIKKEIAEDSCPYGPLTQKLVSCLLQENIMSPSEDTIDNSTNSEVEQSNRSLIRSINMGDPRDLEKRIRKNLEFAGLLDETESEEEQDQDDEVLAELKKVVSSLKALAAYNLELKQKVLKLAKEEIIKQENRKKLDVVDAEIIKLHSKSKNEGTLSEEEKKKAKLLLNQRERLVKLIEPEESA